MSEDTASTKLREMRQVVRERMEGDTLIFAFEFDGFEEKAKDGAAVAVLVGQPGEVAIRNSRPHCAWCSKLRSVSPAGSDRRSPERVSSLLRG